jgi:hypothetical protein
MEDKSVSYIVHEGMMARQERTIKRLWILCIIIFLALIGTNAGWIYYESQFVDEVTESVESVADDGGTAYGTLITGYNNGAYYGTSQSDPD